MDMAIKTNTTAPAAATGSAASIQLV